MICGCPYIIPANIYEEYYGKQGRKIVEWKNGLYKLSKKTLKSLVSKMNCFKNNLQFTVFVKFVLLNYIDNKN